MEDDEGQNVPPPDWDRYRVDSRASGGGIAKVGDPTRWGGSARVVLEGAGPVFSATSPQFLRVQTDDRYGRQWSLTGTIMAPTAWWTGVTTELAALEIVQGVGQTVVTQFFDLRLLATIGEAGGYRFQPGPAERTYSFAMMGALIGQQVAARLLATGPVTGVAIEVHAIVAPLAAGTLL